MKPQIQNSPKSKVAQSSKKSFTTQTKKLPTRQAKSFPTTDSKSTTSPTATALPSSWRPFNDLRSVHNHLHRGINPNREDTMLRIVKFIKKPTWKELETAARFRDRFTVTSHVEKVGEPLQPPSLKQCRQGLPLGNE